MSEWRGWITIPRLEIESDGADDLLSALLDRHDLGPALSGWGLGLDVVIATESGTAAEAAKGFCDAVVDSLRTIGLEHLHPTKVEIELVIS
jgi:hypothetical protein